MNQIIIKNEDVNTKSLMLKADVTRDVRSHGGSRIELKLRDPHKLYVDWVIPGDSIRIMNNPKISSSMEIFQADIFRDTRGGSYYHYWESNCSEGRNEAK